MTPLLTDDTEEAPGQKVQPSTRIQPVAITLHDSIESSTDSRWVGDSSSALLPKKAVTEELEVHSKTNPPPMEMCLPSSASFKKPRPELVDIIRMELKKGLRHVL
jgi:hypothetical protein